MSPLGRMLLNACDNNLCVNLDNNPGIVSTFMTLGRLNIEGYCRALGLTVSGGKRTLYGMPAVKPVSHYPTVMGLPAVRVSSR